MTRQNPLNEPSIERNDEASIKESLEIIKRLNDNWVQIEALIEHSGRTNKLVEAITDYVSDLRKELRFIGRLRLLILCMSFAYVLTINAILIYLLFFDKVFFIFMGGYAKAAIIALVISSSAILFGKMLSGVLTTYEERHKTNQLPSHIRQMVDVINPPKN